MVDGRPTQEHCGERRDLDPVIAVCGVSNGNTVTLQAGATV